MPVLANSFEGGTSGTTVSLANSGGTSGNAFDVVNVGTATTVAFDNAHSAHGGLSCQLATAATSASAFVSWTTSMGSQATAWFRSYFYFTANPAVQHRILNFLSGATAVGNVLLKTNGTLIFTNSAGATVLTTATTIPLGSWWRLEGFVTGDAAAGQWEFRLFTSNPDAAVPDETQTSAATQAMTGAVTVYRFGIGANIVSTGPFWIDDIGLSSTGYLGPAGSAAAAPRSRSVMAARAAGIRGWLSRRAGTFAGTGPAVRALPGPIRAQAARTRGGIISRRAGIFAGTGPPLRAPDGPVQARALPRRGGSVSHRAGTFTATAPQAGPPVYPLGHPVQSRRLPARGGSVSHRAGTFAGSGPPVPALKQPLGIYRRQPPPPARGRVLSLDGIRQGGGPVVRALDGPVRGQPQKPVLYGRADSRAGIAVFVPPPVLQNAASSPTVTAGDTSVLSATGAVHGASVAAQGTSAASATGQSSASSVTPAASSTPSASDG